MHLRGALACVVSSFCCFSISLGVDSGQGTGTTQNAGPADTTGDAGLYVLQPGDEITIKVFELPELEETVRIRPDGRISVQLIDEVIASGLTPGELDDVITAGYEEFYKDPKVSVIVRDLANAKIFVGGEVAAPGLFPFRGKLTLPGAIFLAGGLRNTGKAQDVYLLRDSGTGSPLVMQINLKDVLKKGDPDVVLQPFDVVWVPKKKIARVNLFVDQYIRQVLPFDMTAGFTYLKGDTVAVVPGGN